MVSVLFKFLQTTSQLSKLGLKSDLYIVMRVFWGRRTDEIVLEWLIQMRRVYIGCQHVHPKLNGLKGKRSRVAHVRTLD